MRRYGVSETKNIIPDGEWHGVLVCGVLRCDACDFFSDKESPGGANTQGVFDGLLV